MLYIQWYLDLADLCTLFIFVFILRQVSPDKELLDLSTDCRDYGVKIASYIKLVKKNPVLQSLSSHRLSLYQPRVLLKRPPCIDTCSFTLRT